MFPVRAKRLFACNLLSFEAPRLRMLGEDCLGSFGLHLLLKEFYEGLFNL